MNAHPAAGAVLGIDGALGAFSAALVAADGRTLRSQSGVGNDALEAGLGLIAAVLGDVPPTALARIGVTTGPGTFTGLRIAIAYAKSLAYASGVPLVGVSSFEVLEPAERPNATCITARSGTATMQFRHTSGRVERVAGTEAELARSAADRTPTGETLWVAGAVEGLLSGLGERGIIVRISTVPRPIAPAVARLALVATPLPTAHGLAADYGLAGT